MATWKRLLPTQIDPVSLPPGWDITYDAKLDRYAVVGRYGSRHPDAEHVAVVIRIDFARANDGGDLRHMICTAIIQGMTSIVVRHRTVRPADHAPSDSDPDDPKPTKSKRGRHKAPKDGGRSDD